MNLENTLLMIPGPVPVAPRILRAMAKPMIGHRGKEFGEIYNECRAALGELFQTKKDIFILSGSGSCAMEAAVGNIIGEKDTLVTIENGKFGERFREIGERYGKVMPIKFEWGEPIELDRVEEALAKGAKAVTLVHNDTSVGLKNPAKEVGELARKYDSLFIVDGITSIGGDRVMVDEWGIDIAIVGSQKCLGAPPGLSAVSVSEKAWEAIVEKPPYYMDLKAYKKSAGKETAQTPYTPAIPLFYGLQESLRIIKEEGLEARIERHGRFAEAIRSGARAMGISLFPRLNEISRYSNTVTAMSMPKGIDDKRLRNGVKELGVQISGGQNQLEGKIFRIASMGNISKMDILSTVQALEIVLYRNKVLDECGPGIMAATRVLDGKE